MKKQTEAYWGRWAFAGVMVFLFIICLISFAHGTTRYVKIGGNDTSAGTSWATAWATTDKVQTTLTGGDTVFFGTGTWYDVHFLPPAGTSGDRTVYACSAFVQGIAHLYASEHLTTWVKRGATSIYAAHFTGTNCVYPDVYSPAYCVAQNDSLLPYKTSLPTAEGQSYHNQGNDSIYVWCYGNANPNNCNMEASCHEVFDFRDYNNAYVTVWGFDMRYGSTGIVTFHTTEKDVADGELTNNDWIAHCNLRTATGKTAENPACVVSGKATIHNETDSSYWGYNNRITACSLSNWIDFYEYNHGDAVVLYSQRRFIVDSCYLDGGWIGNVGLFFKNETVGGAFKFNLIKNVLVNPLRVAYAGKADSFYGNTVIGGLESGWKPDDGANLSENPQASPWYTNNSVWYNNTFINCNITGISTSDDQYGGTGGHKFKYNLQFDSLITDSTGRLASFGQTTKSKWTIDSNLIWRPNFGSGAFYYNGDRTLSYWRATVGFDGNSDTTYAHIKFNNSANNDFSRPTSSAEMDQTYGGRTWTRYGAWQLSGTDDSLIQHLTPPTPLYPVNGSMIWGDKIDNLWGPPTDSVALIVGTFNSYDSLFFKAYFIQADSGGLSATGLLENTTYYYASIAIEGSHRDTTAIASLTTTSGQTADRNKIRRLFTKLKE